jgi:hypothetical protein
MLRPAVLTSLWSLTSPRVARERMPQGCSAPTPHRPLSVCLTRLWQPEDCGSCPGHPPLVIPSGELCSPAQGHPEPGGRAVGRAQRGGRAGGGPRLCSPSPPHTWSSSSRPSASGWPACPTPATAAPWSPPACAGCAPRDATAAAPALTRAPGLRAAPAASGSADGR